MPRFFVDELVDDTAVVSGEDAAHISRSLRMKEGDMIVLSKDGNDYDCRIDSVFPDKIYCRVFSYKKSEMEPSINLSLFQAVPKLDKLEFIIQKATELGVCDIYPIMMRRCVSRPDDKTFEKKLERYNKIAREAAKQSGRSHVPRVHMLIPFINAVQIASKSECPLMCYENGGEHLTAEMLVPHTDISVIIGAEGGFDPVEYTQAVEKKIIPVTLGNRILRCETAPVAVSAVIMNLTGNM